MLRKLSPIGQSAVVVAVVAVGLGRLQPCPRSARGVGPGCCWDPAWLLCHWCVEQAFPPADGWPSTLQTWALQRDEHKAYRFVAAKMMSGAFVRGYVGLTQSPAFRMHDSAHFEAHAKHWARMYVVFAGDGSECATSREKCIT